MSETDCLQVRGVSKRFGAVQALDTVDLNVRFGEIHALVGENGAGKSTLINILAGTLQPDCGGIELAGRQLRSRNGHEARRAGIAAVFQELSLVDSLSVAENIFANRQPVNRFNLIRSRELRSRTREILGLFDIALDPDAPVERLSPAERQVVEILKALSVSPCVLLLDEPTSSLGARETRILFSLIRRLRNDGRAVIYISHHLSEVLELADRVTVFRDGRHVATREREGLTERELIRLMVGRELSDIYGRRAPMAASDGPRLEIEGLCRRGSFEGVNLEIQPGEIVGLAGLVGAGRTELGRALFGAEPADHGRILLDGREVRPRSPAQAVRLGIAYISEDRKSQGLFLRHSIRDNLAAPRLKHFSRGGFLRDRAVDVYARSARERFRIAAPDVFKPAGQLSGGNQQKVLMAMWIGTEPKLLIADEPTRGVDVGARAEIYAQLRELTARGVAVLLISSDLQEILGMSDRVMVMRGGRLVAGFQAAEATEEGIIAAALGAAEPERRR